MNFVTDRALNWLIRAKEDWGLIQLQGDSEKSRALYLHCPFCQWPSCSLKYYGRLSCAGKPAVLSEILGKIPIIIGLLP